MNPETLEPLLDNLCRGDMAAARQVFLACESYLRNVVRRQLPSRLQAKFDSIDIVQSVWADMLRGCRAGAWHFADARHFQAFLVQVTRNRFNDKFRKHRLALEREQRLDGVPTSDLPAGYEPGAPEVAQAEDLWELMLSLCPPEHRELLKLKRQGVPMDTMVARTGLHPGSIRRIFRNLARKLALQE
jgi:RNA polymerase sigma factor (sigma-70 family)